MNWAAIQAAIKVAVVSALGVEERLVQWTNTAGAAQWRQPVRVDLTLRAPRAIGVDEARREYDAGSDSLQWEQTGPRVFTVQVKLEAETQSPGSETVGAMASTFRTRLQRKSILAALRTAGVALSSIGVTTDADYKADGRMVSASITDVVWLAAESDQDPTASGDYIGKVTGTGTYGPPPNITRDLEVPTS